MEMNAEGGAQGNLSSKTIASFLILRPTNELEQQRIADCLSFLDDLIAAQARKVELLKQHKKGLMQQMFPTLKDVEG